MSLYAGTFVQALTERLHYVILHLDKRLRYLFLAIRHLSKIKRHYICGLSKEWKKESEVHIMKKIPDAELELMMVIWDAGQPVSRMDIEMRMQNGRDVVPSTILSLLSRLEKRGFLRKEKQGNINYYNALVEKSAYLKEEGQRVLDKMFGSSLKNFVTALYDGKGLDDREIAELQAFIDEQAGTERDK